MQRQPPKAVIVSDDCRVVTHSELALMLEDIGSVLGVSLELEIPPSTLARKLHQAGIETSYTGWAGTEISRLRAELAEAQHAPAD